MLDNTDIQLLKLLQKNAALTTKELAKLVNLSVSPVFERVKRLERNGYIKKYRAILDAEKLSRGFVVFCYIRLKQHSRKLGEQFREAIMQIDEITECYNISGDYDFMLKIHVENMQNYQNLILNTLGVLDCIGGLQSNFVMGELKNSYAIPLKEK